MNQQMNNSSCILRKRKECPTDPLDNWKLNKRIKEDAIFFEPLLTGGSLLFVSLLYFLCYLVTCKFDL